MKKLIDVGAISQKQLSVMFEFVSSLRTLDGSLTEDWLAVHITRLLLATPECKREIVYQIVDNVGWKDCSKEVHDLTPSSKKRVVYL